MRLKFATDPSFIWFHSGNLTLPGPSSSSTSGNMTRLIGCLSGKDIGATGIGPDAGLGVQGGRAPHLKLRPHCLLADQASTPVGLEALVRKPTPMDAEVCHFQHLGKRCVDFSRVFVAVFFGEVARAKETLAG